ncbi:MAG TPA: TIR domain-containing protein [Caulobacteraceae bacterium]|nr:TIR domain-containing protein [Caulobacteraceae bacterium]
MTGVFLSYSRADRALAERVVNALRRLDIDVWWDEFMPGVNWQRELARQIDELAAVLVIWTPNSVASENVADEARLGRHKHKLVNATCGVTSPPFPFDAINALPLDGWTGRESHSGWRRLVQTLEAHLVEASAVEPGALMSALDRREALAAAAAQAIVEAEAAFQRAQGDDAAAAKAVEAATRAFQQAQAQLSRVIEIEGTSALLRAAQSEVDATLSARESAEAARREAAAGLAVASRAVAAARAERERFFEESPPPRVLSPDANSDAATTAPEVGVEPPEPLAAPAAARPAAEPAPESPSATRPSEPKTEDGSPGAEPAKPEPIESIVEDPLLEPQQRAVPAERRAMEPPLASAPASRLEAAATDRSAAIGAEDPRRLQGEPSATRRTSPLTQPATRSLRASSGVRRPLWRRRVWLGAAAAVLATGVGAWLFAPTVYDIMGEDAYGRHDYVAALQLWTVAAERGNRDAAMGLSDLYGTGQGVGRDDVQSIRWLAKAAAEGDAIGMLLLAESYDNGIRVAKNESTARYWYQQAAARGMPDAKSWLAEHPQ